MTRKILIAIGSTILAAGLAALLIYVQHVYLDTFFVLRGDFPNNLTIVVGVFLVATVAKIFYDLFTKN